MLLTTTETIPGREYEIIGLVQGGTVQSKHIGKDFGAGFKTIVGGEIKGYSEMMEEARSIATERLIRQAQSKGADAVVSLRYGSSAVMQGAAEVIAYGTAVRFV